MKNTHSQNHSGTGANIENRVLLLCPSMSKERTLLLRLTSEEVQTSIFKGMTQIHWYGLSHT